MLTIRATAPEPIYRQILEQLRRLIAGGQLTVGDLLPSVREVAGHHAINPMTVSRAYSLAESEGLLVRLRGKGMAVAANASNAHGEKQRMTMLEPHLCELVRMSHELELPAASVVQRLKKLFGE